MSPARAFTPLHRETKDPRRIASSINVSLAYFVTYAKSSCWGSQPTLASSGVCKLKMPLWLTISLGHIAIKQIVTNGTQREKQQPLGPNFTLVI